MVQFRVKALNQLQKPDDLDLLMKVTKLRGWIALAALGALVAGIIVWSFMGRMPVQVEGEGLLSRPAGVTQIDSTVGGQVLEVLYDEGQVLKVGDPLVRLITADGTTTTVTSNFPGHVVAALIDEGNYIEPGDPLVNMERSDVKNDRLLAFLFVDSGQGQNLAPGMDVDLTVASAPVAAFGVLRGTVTAVDRFPATEAEINDLISNEQLAAEFMADGPPVRVTVDLVADPSTPSGLRWSTKTGPPAPLDSGIRVSGAVIQARQAPIDLVFGK